MYSLEQSLSRWNFGQLSYLKGEKLSDSLFTEAEQESMVRNKKIMVLKSIQNLILTDF